MTQFIVAGDSHIQQFMGRDHPCLRTVVSRPPFQCFWLGPATCWSFKKNCKDALTKILNENWHPGDGLIISCGEIDCRHHAIAQAKLQNITVRQSAEAISVKYLELLDEFKAWNPIAMGLPPQMDVTQNYDPKWPKEERNIVINIFNDMVSKHDPFWPSPGYKNRLWMPDGIHVVGEEARVVLVELANSWKAKT